MHRASGDGVKRAGFGIAVLFKTSFEQNHETGLAARRRSQQEEQPAAHFRTCGRCLEVVEHTCDGVVQSEQLARKQRASKNTVVAFLALRAEHVPDILVAGARCALGLGPNDGLEECRERSRPMLRLTLAREADQAIEKLCLASTRVLLSIGMCGSLCRSRSRGRCNGKRCDRQCAWRSVR